MNWPLVIAVLFWIQENYYFGWNARPQSDAEMICDGIVQLLLALSFIAKRKESK